jgi:hypothetical protein
MKLFMLLVLAFTLSASEPNNQPVNDVPSAISMVAKLPDPQVSQHLHDFFIQAKPEEAGQVLMQIAIGAVRPARDLVVPMLGHRDPLVIERALRAMTSIGFVSIAQRQTIENLLTHDQTMVAAQAANCLGAGGDVRAIPALIRGLKAKPEVATSAQRALQQLSGVDFKSDHDAWEAWYSGNRLESAQRLEAPAKNLTAEDPKERIVAVQALGNQRQDRLEVLALLEPMLNDLDASVVLATRQSLAMLAPDQYAMPTTEEVKALIKPVSEPQLKVGVIGYLTQQGFFDTWFGLFITAFTAICILSIILYVLRSPPVKNMTRRFNRVVVTATARFVSPVTSRVKSGTRRIIKAVVRNNSRTSSLQKNMSKSTTADDRATIPKQTT